MPPGRNETVLGDITGYLDYKALHQANFRVIVDLSGIIVHRLVTLADQYPGAGMGLANHNLYGLTRCAILCIFLYSLHTTIELCGTSQS